jgi:glycosyltransferase
MHPEVPAVGKTISIITASFRSAGTIADTMRSINAQTYPDIEHIIVDGGSNDETLEIVKREGKRVAQVVSERDKGIYDAYNKGLALTHGEVIGFLNSDDFYCTDKAVAMVMAAFEDPTVEACYADLVYVDWDDTTKILRHWKSRPYRQGSFRTGFVPPHPTLFLRKSVYDRVGGFDLRYRLAADYQFMLRAFHGAGIKSVYIPQIIVKMRAGGATSASFKNVRKQNVEILQALREQGVSPSAADFLLRKVYDRTLQRLRAPFVRLQVPAP